MALAVISYQNPMSSQVSGKTERGLRVLSMGEATSTILQQNLTFLVIQMEGVFGGYHSSLCSKRSCTGYNKKSSSRTFHAHAISLILLVELAQEGVWLILQYLSSTTD